MNVYAIRNHDDGMPTGYLIGGNGPVIFASKREAESEAKRMNAMPHAPGRIYRAEPIKD